MEKIEKKFTALTLVMVATLAAMVGGLIATTNPANAAETNPTTQDTTNSITVVTSASSALDPNAINGTMIQSGSGIIIMGDPAGFIPAGPDAGAISTSGTIDWDALNEGASCTVSSSLIPAPNP